MTDLNDQITVTVTGFGGSQEVQVPRGSSIEVAANGADVSPEAVIRFKGQRISPEQRDAVVVDDGDTLAAAPPEAKQGL